jgi:hypothetical protein
VSQVLSVRASEALLALIEGHDGLRLGELAEVLDAPLSSVQRTIEGLLDEGVVVQVGSSRPHYRLAPEVPAGALAELASWRVSPPRARLVRQAAAAFGSPGSALDGELSTSLRAALDEEGVAVRLHGMARRLMWWMRPSDALGHPARLIAQAMAIGTTEDAELAEHVFGEEAMRKVLATAPPGVFDRRRWDLWHLRFGYRRTPPLPTRG